MNIDKGNQSQPGPDMDTIGHVGVTDTTSVYAIKINDNAGKPFSFTTDGTGEVWFIVGTDSGFEATTAIYFTKITVDLEIVSSADQLAADESVLIIPNPGLGNIMIRSDDHDIRGVRVYDVTGGMILDRDCNLKNMDFAMPAGVYVVLVDVGDRVVVRKVVVN
jgi:hypothetical protein